MAHLLLEGNTYEGKKHPMAKITHGVIDPRSGRFHPVSTPSPTRTGRGSLGRANDGHLDTAVSTAQGVALQTGRPTKVASRVVDDSGNATIIEHGTVRGVMKGAKPVAGSGNQIGRSTSNPSA
jgi:hypothetical protein